MFIMHCINPFICFIVFIFHFETLAQIDHMKTERLSTCLCQVVCGLHMRCCVLAECKPKLALVRSNSNRNTLWKQFQKYPKSRPLIIL